MDHSSISEITAGLVLAGRISPRSVGANLLEPPYDTVVRLIQKGGDETSVTMEVGLHVVATCMAAAESISEKEDLTKYLRILEEVALRVEVGNKLQLEAKRLMQGESIDVTKAQAALNRLDSGLMEFTTLDKVEPESDMMIPTFFEPWDRDFGGVPKSGMVLLAAPPKVGKTTTILQIIDAMTKHKKEIGILSLEMPNAILLSRWIEINTKLTKAQRSRVHISDGVYSIDEAEIALTRLLTQHPDIYCVFIDFADLMIPEKTDESTEIAGRIYRAIARVAKLLNKPIILLSQLNSNYVGGIPKVNHIRWSRLAEAVAVMVILIFNVDRLWVDQGQDNKKNPQLPYVEGKGYLILGACRYKTPHKRLGAIQMSWLDDGYWDASDASWFPL